MKDWWPRIIILLALAVVLGVPLAFEPAQATRTNRPAAGDPDSRLIIYSPHNDQIRFEFEYGFNQWRRRQGLTPVEFDWRAGGGTTDIRKKLLAEFFHRARLGIEEQGIGVDLFFGGGDFEHDVVARGITITRGGSEVRIPITVPVEFPEGMMKEIFPRSMIGGERLHHEDLLWVGATLSSFGIVYNRDLLRMLALPEPVTWSDLRHEEYRHHVALADPGHSGSIAATYGAILRRLGWTEGWSLLRRVFANARYFTSSASKVPVDVSAGEAAAGMCIDFYGRFQAGAIGDDRVGYADPPFMTAITADPISILRGAPHRQLANEFVLWLLSREGQRLWQYKAGAPGGPQVYELRRLPVRPDLYDVSEKIYFTDDVDPFAIAKPFAKGMPNYYGTIKTVSHAMAIDIHDELVAAWDAIIKHPNHPRREEMLTLFDRMPDELTMHWPDVAIATNWVMYLEDAAHPRHAEAAAIARAFLAGIEQRWQDPDQELKDRLRWTLFFRDNYRRVAAMGRDRSHK